MPSKRYKKASEVVDSKKAYPLKDAVAVLAKFPKAKFNETIDLAFRLGVDPKQSDQMVRGTVPLPHGSGKVVRVLVFARGNAAEAAKAAGAENVGFEDMIAKCVSGWSDFDVAIATPEAMIEVRKLGKVTRKQVLDIIKLKSKDMNTTNEEAAFRVVAGTARSMGIEVVG